MTTPSNNLLNYGEASHAIGFKLVFPAYAPIGLRPMDQVAVVLLQDRSREATIFYVPKTPASPEMIVQMLDITEGVGSTANQPTGYETITVLNEQVAIASKAAANGTAATYANWLHQGHRFRLEMIGVAGVAAPSLREQALSVIQSMLR